ncbi:MAG: hypothetical protein AAF492_15120, partial [Verrucomicrobiota bacterium]
SAFISGFIPNLPFPGLFAKTFEESVIPVFVGLSARSSEWSRRVAWLRNWFVLTPQDRWLIGGILLIALIGLTVRFFHMKAKPVEPDRPAETVPK